MSKPEVPFYPMTHDDMIEINEALYDIKNALTGERKKNIVYGFHIDATESDPSDCVTYLEDAIGMVPAHMDYTNNIFDYGSWTNAFFMPRPCMLKYNGIVDYYLDPDNYAKKYDGVTNSDVANSSYDGNAMMEWGQNGQKIWYKILPDIGEGTSTSVYISNYKVDDDYHAWSFINSEGNYVDHFYTPCYFGTIVNNGSQDVLRSLSGQSGANRCKDKNAQTERDMARRNNTSKAIWDTEVYCDVILINLLLVLIGKSLNTQAVFGQGLNTSGTDTINDGFTSGVHDTKGLFYGTNSDAASTYTNAVKVFGMENWWGYMWRRIGGLVNVKGTEKYKLTRSTADGSAVSDYVISSTDTDYAGYLTGNTLPEASGSYIQTMAFDANQCAPKTASGTASTYYCDGFWTNNTQVDYAYRGGYSNVGAPCGAWYLFLDNAAGSSSWSFGAAASCKPI